MLPNAQHSPAFFSKKAVHPPISALVLGQFFGPEASVRSRNAAVDRAPMPKTAVHKHGQTLLSEHEIRATRQPLLAAPTSDQVFPEDLNEPQFRRPISRRADARHHSGAFFGAVDISHHCGPGPSDVATQIQ